MSGKSRLKLCLMFVGSTAAACAGYIFGYNHGYDADDHASIETPIIAVPENYLAGLEPVPFVPNGSFSFDTFVFVNDKGQEMAVPLPNVH